MPFIAYNPKEKGLVNLEQAARLCGVHPLNFWRLVKKEGLLDSPRTKLGSRYYYDGEQLKEVAKQVAELRLEGGHIW